jgi:hypothetical protein
MIGIIRKRMKESGEASRFDFLIGVTSRVLLHTHPLTHLK